MNVHFILNILPSQFFSFIASFISSFAIYLVLDKGFWGLEVGIILVINKPNAVTLTQV